MDELRITYLFFNNNKYKEKKLNQYIVCVEFFSPALFLLSDFQGFKS